MAHVGQHLLRTTRWRRAPIFVLTVVATIILAAAPHRAQATIIEKIGAFNVTYYESGDTIDGVTGQKDWTATERADAAATIMTWSMLLGNSLATPRAIELSFVWNDLPGNVLGQSSNQFTITSGTWRTKAERLWRTGVNTTLSGVGYDTLITFDSGTNWHTGASGPSGGQFDFRTVVMHELGHTLGFVSAYNSTSDTWALGSTGGVTEFDKHLRDAASGGNTPLAGSTGTPGNFNQLANPVYFDGTNANAANGGARVAIYAPGTYEGGSSLTHLNDSTFSSALMKHALSSGTAIRAPTAVETAIMQDLGWTIITTKTWDKGAGTLNWTESNNWNGDGVPAATDTVSFTNTGIASADTVNLGGNATVGGFNFDTTTDFSVGGGSGTITLSRGLLMRSGASSGTQTIARPMSWSGVGNWHIDGSGQLAVSGAIGSTAGIYKTGLGTLALSGGNNFSSAVTVAGGVLDISNATALGTTAAGTTVTNEAALQVQNTIGVGSEALSLAGNGPSGGGALRSTSGANSWAGNISLAANSAIGVDSSTLTLSGTVSGSASLTKVGAGTLLLSHANTYTLGTNVNGGTLSVSADNFLGSGPLALSGGGSLQLTGSSAISSSKSLAVNSGGGTLNITNSAGVTLTGAVTIAANQTLSKSGGGALSVTGPLSWGADSTVSLAASSGATNLLPAPGAAVSVADTNALLSIAAGVTLTVNAANNDPFSDDSANLHVSVQNDSTTAGFQITAGSVTVGNLDGSGNATVAANVALTANHIRQNMLTIQGSAGQPNSIVTLSRSGVDGSHPNGTPAGFDSEVSVVNSLTLASNLATIDPPPSGGYTGAERQYFGTLDLVNNDLIIKNGSPALFAEVQDMIRAGLYTNGARGVTSQEALVSGDYAGLTWIGSIYNGYDDDFNPVTPDVPLFASFDGVPLVGGEILIKYTWFGDVDLSGTVDSVDASFYTTGLNNGDPNAAQNPWLFGDFDYSGIVDTNDASFYTTGFLGGGTSIHLPEPQSVVLFGLGLPAFILASMWQRRHPGERLRR